MWRACRARLAGAVLERGGRGRDVLQTDVARLLAEACEPAQGGAFVRVGVALLDHEQDRGGVTEADAGKLGGRGADQEQVAGLQRPSESRVRVALTGHEHTFAHESNLTVLVQWFDADGEPAEVGNGRPDRDRRPAQRGAAISCGYDEALNW